MNQSITGGSLLILSSLHWAAGSSAVKREWKTILKNTAECKTRTRSWPLSFFKNWSSSEGAIKGWNSEHLEFGHLSKASQRELSDEVKLSKIMYERRKNWHHKGQNESEMYDFDMLKLRMNLNLQKILKLPRRHGGKKQQKEWIKQCHGLTIEM